jgi:hypothetical protein
MQPNQAPAGAALRLLGLAITLLLAAPAFAQDPMFVKSLPAHAPLTITLHDDIASPIYTWPRTLLTYPVDFSARKIKVTELQLTADGQPIPFQLSDIKTAPDATLTFAKLSFFSTLTPGATHTFSLDPTPTPRVAPPTPALTVTHDATTRTVDAGALKIRMPTGYTGPDVPGPILALDQGQGPIGASHLLGPAINHVNFQTLASGPLFDLYRITYTFANGGAYTVTLRSVLGYPFVQITEDMTNLPPEANAAVEIDWTGLNPTKRYAANGWLESPEGIPIDEPVTTPGILEEPHWFPSDRVEDPAHEMLYHLAAFGGNAPREAVPAIDFWEPGPQGQDLSAFIPDTKLWDDHQYMIWQPTTRLQWSFRYTPGHLIFHLPLIDGTRTTDIALTPAKQDESTLNQVRQTYQQAARALHGAFTRNTTYPASLDQRYAQYLRSWYGGLSLDKVKDWQLTYPSTLKPPPPPYLPPSDKGSGTLTPGLTPQALETFIFTSPVMNYPLGLDLGVMNISHRIIRPIVERYLQLRPTMPEDLRRRIDAVLLLSAYVNAGEDISPMRICVTGTPNMSADGFSVPAELSVLYPQHPMVPEWADQFEKIIQLQSKFYTRPDVPALDSLGGRWTESLPIYNWAFFAPTIAAQVSLMNTDGRDRMANPEMALRGRWMVDELSAPIWNPNPIWRVGNLAKAPTTPTPWHPGLALTPANGFERQYPAHGAHSSGTSSIVPKDVPMIAFYLRNYAPLISEHLLWAYAQRTSTIQPEGDEPFWQLATLKKVANNPGTNPHLKSEKYTGHGLILRAGVDTPDELSIHLDQVDQGPNYRWGDNAEGSSGVLYFFANGQPYTGLEQENTGDHSIDDATGFTTFAVLHDHAWRSIGENLLTSPLYDLGIAQFGQIDARRDHNPYSYPAYLSRSVMLIGTDYFILADDTQGETHNTGQGETRFTWFTAKDLPYPKIAFLTPLVARVDHWTQLTTRMSKGFIRDAVGPSVVLISAKKDEIAIEHMRATPLAYPEGVGLSQYTPDHTSETHPGVFYIRTATSHDRVFRAFAPIHYQESDEAFQGTAGVIRTRTSGATELALFHGTLIAAKDLRLELPPNTQTAISATLTPDNTLTGAFQSQSATSLTLTLPAAIATTATFYIDGAKPTQTRTAQTLTLALPAGRHTWELTPNPPTPIPPTILRTENAKASAKVFFTPVPAAQSYRLELSQDNAVTWKPAAEGKTTPLTLQNLTPNTKYQLRIAAITPDNRAIPGPEYPIYATLTPPPTPDGLALEITPNTVQAQWGEVLGASEYRLYRRLTGQARWTLVYHGLDRQTADHAPGITAPTYMPGRADNSLTPRLPQIYEYAVTSVNGSGESEKSPQISTDPTSWLTWWPTGQDHTFKRQTGFWLPPYVPAAATPPLHYPTQP